MNSTRSTLTSFPPEKPLAGQVALMAEAKAIGRLYKEGWRPRRTLVYASWDGEEPGLLGSTEWAETHAAELKAKAPDILETIRKEREISNATEEKLKGFLDQFMKTFA